MALNPFFTTSLDPFSGPRGYDKDFEGMATSLAQALMAGSTAAAAAATRNFEVEETDDSYRISVDVPGFKSSDLKIELESGCECSDCNCRDCSCGSCQCQSNKVVRIFGKKEKGKQIDKRYTLGSNLDAEKLTANIEHGVLVLEAPKLQPPEPKVRTIEVSES
ncbi:hypothetical protein MPSEU_000058000 [Mayamaea pseudoterrestris]|nr:hypothetical protein MPSEU_000058000 [Mayamaea pseudoterrestris]